MWFKKKAYYRFLFRSFHLHGIHSPFIFQLSKVCFKGKKEEVLSLLVDYLKIDSVLFFGNFSERIFKNTNEIVMNPSDKMKLELLMKENPIIDLIYFSNKIQNLTPLFQKALLLAHNDSVFVFEKIHHSKEMEKNWEYIKKNKQVSASIDAFHFGLVFFRSEQAKEDFTIRIASQ